MLIRNNDPGAVDGEGADGRAVHVAEQRRLDAPAEKGHPVFFLAHRRNLIRQGSHGFQAGNLRHQGFQPSEPLGDEPEPV